MAGVKWQTTAQPGIWKRDLARGGRRYRVVVRDKSGTQRTMTKSTFEAARQWQRENIGEDRPRSNGRTLRQVFEQQEQSRSYADETLGVRRAAWRYVKRLGDTPIDRITPTDIDGVLSKVASPSMREKVRALLSVTFAFAIERNYVRANPVLRSKVRRTRRELLDQRPKNGDRRRYLDHDELDRLVDAIPERFAALVRLMGWVGLRPGEALALRVGKFTPENGKPASIRIDTSVTGATKTGEAREVLIPSIVSALLVDHIAKFSDSLDPGALIFTTETDGPIDPDNFRKRTFATAARAAGVPDVTPNLLRHTAAALAISTGADVYSVQRMLGHAKASITLDTYGSLWSDAAEKFVERYDAALRASLAC
jgi:integrase